MMQIMKLLCLYLFIILILLFVAIYDLSTKLEFSAQYKVQGLDFTPLCLDYW